MRLPVALILMIAPLVLTACLPKVSTQGTTPSKGEFVQGAIVKGFPENLPVYEGAQVVESFGSGQGYGASFIVDGDLQKVVDFYSASLGQLGWQQSLRTQSSDNFVFEIKNATYAGSVIVNTAADGKSVAVTMFVSGR